MIPMIENLQTLLNRTIDNASAQAHALIDRASRLAGSSGMLIFFILLGAMSFLTLAAAAVVALAPVLGVAAALAIIGGAVGITSAIGGVVAWKRIATPAVCTFEPVAGAHQVGTPAHPQLGPHQEAARLEAAIPDPALPPIQAIKLPEIDPLFVAASVGAAAALLGPARLLRVLGTVTAGVAVAKNLAPLADAFHKYREFQEVNQALADASSQSKTYT